MKVYEIRLLKFLVYIMGASLIVCSLSITYLAYHKIFTDVSEESPIEIIQIAGRIVNIIPTDGDIINVLWKNDNGEMLVTKYKNKRFVAEYKFIENNNK